ncbi:hypothetical protein Mapa_009255 [Marchantia paleacea]|nr:hypothetical protein Mapa_009255 [Marchantia paleacea]
MASEVESRLVDQLDQQTSEWVDNLSQNGYLISGAVRCNPTLTTVADCQTCINTDKDLLVTQLCATQWNARSYQQRGRPCS